jgi:glutamate dehydrogenase/leucine dehydrogenase
MNKIFDEIKKNVPDLEYARLNYSYIMSRREAQEKVEATEKLLEGLAVYYELTGKTLRIYFSPAMKKEWGGNIAGKKVRLVGTDMVGEVTSEELFFCGPSRCVRCQFGNDDDAYDITALESI